MKNEFFRQYLAIIYRAFSSTIRKFALGGLKVLFSIASPRLFLLYDNEKTKDGFGAQLHRILSLIHTAHYMHLRIVRPQISDLAIHPLDPFYSSRELHRFLDNANDFLFASPLFLDKSELISDISNFKVGSIKIYTLVKLALKSLVKRKAILLSASEAHSICDLNPNFYQDCIASFFENVINEINCSRNFDEIVIHYRQGPGNFAVYPGQRISRQMSINYFLIQLTTLAGTLDVSKMKLKVYTDAPRNNLVFQPPPDQLLLWEGTPGFERGKVTYVGNDLESVIEPIALQLGLSFTIERNADPLQMVIQMARSSILITSRSSLSYVGGLFNTQGRVFAAPKFWHQNPDSWIITKWRT